MCVWGEGEEGRPKRMPTKNWKLDRSYVFPSPFVEVRLMGDQLPIIPKEKVYGNRRVP